MMPLSGSPSRLTVTQVGKVSASASARKIHEAWNFATIACQGATGSVSSSSIVPERRSSAHTRMPTAGTSTKYTHGCQPKNAARLASPRSKKLPAVKVKKPVRSRKMTRITYATGLVKYAYSSRLVIVQIVFMNSGPGPELFLHRVRKGYAAEDFVELAALAVHAFHFPAVLVHELDDFLRELSRLRLVPGIDAERAVQLLDTADGLEPFLRGAARLQRDGAGEVR